jgi:hypothetical protein
MAAAACRPRGPSRPPLLPQLSTLEPATHAYACWEGMPRTAKVAFGALFAKARTLQVSSAWRGGTLRAARAPQLRRARPPACLQPASAARSRQTLPAQCARARPA